MTYAVHRPGSAAPFFPDCWLCGGYVLPMYSEVDRINLGVHRQYIATTSPAVWEERRSAAGAVNGISHLRSIGYGIMALLGSAADLLFAARMALNQSWLRRGGPISTVCHPENSKETGIQT